MRDIKAGFAVFLIALFIVVPARSLAGDDPAILYKTKCAACHGADGLAATPMGKKQSIPSFASDKVQKTPNADLEDFILTGGKEKKASHAFGSKGITADDARKLATLIKSFDQGVGNKTSGKK